MTAENFYEEFKMALKMLGLSWGEQDKATIWVDGTHFWMQANGKLVGIELLKPST